ncbi:putative GTP-binding protein EngB [Gammaproteobacteria bacterium]|nr:YihA family ribosome biogenesis GTP-binding protein [Gammaproteobacteria bacterium]CAG0942743.1 putative GTP-binding protein EngB [Gammaproteobacteria bacterium]
MAGYPEARFLSSAHRPDQFLPDEGAEVAFAGRSNSGKSSAINAITNRRQLARTSRTPGRTQLVNFFHLEPGARAVDLPGYGFAKVTEATQAHWRQLLETYFRSRASLRGLFLAVDSRRGLGPLDLQMLGWCASLGRPVHVLLTKADKLGRAEATATLRSATAAAGPGVTMQLFSAATGDGVDAARARLREMLLG